MSTNSLPTRLICLTVVLCAVQRAGAWGVGVAGGSGSASAPAVYKETYLTAYWRLEEATGTRADSVGVMDLSEAATAVGNFTGIQGTAADFEIDDTTDVLSVTSAGNVTPTGTLAVSCWWNSETLPSGQNILFAKTTTAGNLSFAALVTNLNVVTSYLTQTNESTKTLTGGSCGNATWHQVVLIAWGGNVTLYVDGTLVDTEVYDGTIKTANQDAWILGGTSAAVGAWDGLIDEVGFFKDIDFADAAERANFVATLYNGGSGRAFSEFPMDTTPDAFTFTDQTGANLSVVTASANITVAGIDADAAISVSGGNYSINGGAWTSAAGNVNLNDQVQAQVASSASYNTTVSATVTIGGVGDTFSVTTRVATLADWDVYFTGYWNLDEANGNRDDSRADNTLQDSNGVGSRAAFYGTFAADYNAGAWEALWSSDLANVTMTTGIAVSVWIQRDAYTATGIVEVTDAGDTPGYALLVDNADKLWWVSGGNTTGANTTLADDGNWHHIVGIIGGNMAYLFVDGAAVASGACTVPSAAAVLRVGYDSQQFLGYFDGGMDEIGWWKDPVFADATARQTFVNLLYNSGAGRFWNGVTWTP